MSALRGVIHNYAWGSLTDIPGFLGVAPDGLPQAELWLGAHPSSPSIITSFGNDVSLTEAIAADPESLLGGLSRTVFGDEMPFLLKVLAAASPLSIQAHPSKVQAVAGFAAEEAAGVPLNASHRVFKDRHHKPEMIVALTPFVALCGFREVERTAELFERLSTPATLGIAARLRAHGAEQALRVIVTQLLSLGKDAALSLLSEVTAACKRFDDAEYTLVTYLAECYPGDIGAVVSLLLNHVVLQPGEALCLPSGNMHAYISGLGVELMANSDNVVRGGLTPKHVDVATLLDVVDFTPLADPLVRPTTRDDGIEVYPSPSAEFKLSRVTVGDVPVHCTVIGPEVLLCVGGRVKIEPQLMDDTQLLVSGGASFVPAAVAGYQLTGEGVVFRATIGL
jgi:mannose-6-phosphate isomerase